MSGSGAIFVPTTDLRYRVILGQVPNFSAVENFGTNRSIASTEEEIWAVGGIERLLPSAETMDIVSDDNDDNSAGTGARTLTISGLNGSYLEIEETISLNGTTPVTTTATFLRVFKLRVRTAGTSGDNEGSIDCTSTISGFDHARIEPGDNQSLKTQYTVPDNKFMAIFDIAYGTNQNDQAFFRLFIRPEGEVFQLFLVLNLFQTSESNISGILSAIPPRADVSFRAFSAGGGSISVTAAYSFYLIDTP